VIVGLTAIVCAGCRNERFRLCRDNQHLVAAALLKLFVRHPTMHGVLIPAVPTQAAKLPGPAHQDAPADALRLGAFPAA
jgi:hypothetical protein